METYRRVTTLRPDDPEAYRALAIGQEDAGQIREARQSLERSLALDPGQLSGYQDLAALYLREKDLDGAKKVYLRYELKRTELIRTLGLSSDEEARQRAAPSTQQRREQ